MVSVDVRPLNPQQERALSSLLLYGSPKRAGTSAGVSERTVRRWLDSGAFTVEYRRGARLLAAEAATDLLAAQRLAVATLRDGMTGGSAATRVRAARAVLELAARMLDDDTEARLLELEERAQRWDGTTFGLASTG